MSIAVSVGIVTWNSAATVERCLAAVRKQTHRTIELIVVDNASSDATRDLIVRHTGAHERVLLDRNAGYAAAHNLAIARTTGDYYLALNADVFLSATFVATLAGAAADVDVIQSDPRIGAAAGKLFRADDPTRIDSTGIYMVPSQRHLDRGAGEVDRGQYDRRELVFGVTGAAAFYRRTMLADVAVDGEVFDEDFFAYREDADLAWRAQLLGWHCLYVPDAVAHHVRRVTPERRASLPAELNRMSVRNRFLLRIKNQPAGHAARFLGPALWRDAQVIGYALVRERTSLPGLIDVIRLLPRTLRKRRLVMARRRIRTAELARWFRERSRPIGG